MAVPTWTTNEVLLSGDVNSWFVPQVAYKTTDGTTVANSTSPVSDSDLVITTLAANAVYAWQGVIFYRASAVGDMQHQWTFPSGTTAYISATPHDGTGGTFTDPPVWQQGTSPINYSVGGNGASSFLCSPFQGLIVMGVNAGTLQFQYAQVVSDVTACQPKAGSWMTLWRVG